MTDPHGQDRNDPSRRGTVGVYDRPASADRRGRLIKVGVWVIAAATAVAGWWLSGAPGLGG